MKKIKRSCVKKKKKSKELTDQSGQARGDRQTKDLRLSTHHILSMSSFLELEAGRSQMSELTGAILAWPASQSLHTEMMGFSVRQLSPSTLKVYSDKNDAPLWRGEATAANLSTVSLQAGLSSSTPRTRILVQSSNTDSQLHWQGFAAAGKQSRHNTCV